MAVELITGHAGSAHISSVDDGYCNGGLIGAGRYVLNIGTKFAAEVQSANVVTIGTGAAVFNGRYVRVTAAENVAIDNGAQGVNRNDIIAFKYEYDSGTSVETVSLAVIKGTATSSSTPTDPTVPTDNIINGATTAYMALWRIPIRGITVNDPENLYGDVLITHAGVMTRVWDVSQIPNLPASKVTSGTFAAERIPSLDASKITSGTLALARIPSIDASRVPNIDASKVTTGTFAAARIPSLDASKIATGTLSADRIPSLSASKIATGTLSADRIPNLSAAKITSGTLASDRIPSLDAAKITSGTFATARIPNIDASKVTSGTFETARIPTLAASKITSGTFGVDRIPTLTDAKIPNLAASKITSGTFAIERLQNVAWTYAAGNSSATFYVRWCKVAHIVHVEVMGSKSMAANTDVLLSSTAITSGNRPSKEVDSALYSGEDHIGVLWVDTSGRVHGKFLGAAMSYAYGSLSYPVL